jgi:hypothetical protein
MAGTAPFECKNPSLQSSDSLRTSPHKILKFPNKNALFPIIFRFVARCVPYTREMRNEARTAGSRLKTDVPVARPNLAIFLRKMALPPKFREPIFKTIHEIPRLVD